MSPSSSDLDSKTISKAQRDRRRSYRRSQRYGQPSIISCDHCAGVGKPCIRMSKNGRPDLTCSECRRRGRPCVSLSWNAVERAVDKAELEVKDLEKKRQTALDSLLELEASLKSKRRILEFAETRAKEQFWCLERELEESGHPNLYAQVREATDMERELFGDLLAPSDPSAEVPPGPFLARMIFSYQLLTTFQILLRLPSVFFVSVPFPFYQIFSFSAVEDSFHEVLLSLVWLKIEGLL